MTECDIVTKDGKRVIKRIGIELCMPVVIKNKICHVSISEELMMYCCGVHYPNASFGISETQLVWLNMYILFFKEDFKKLEMMYRNSTKPEYMQLMVDYLKKYYSFGNLSFWLKVFSDNFKFIDKVFTNCKSEREAKNKIPGLANYLRLHAAPVVIH